MINSPHPDSTKKKKSGPFLLNRSKDRDKNHTDLTTRFPVYISTPPYVKGEVPEAVDDYVHHLLSALEQAKQAYEELEKKVH